MSQIPLLPKWMRALHAMRRGLEIKTRLGILAMCENPTTGNEELGWKLTRINLGTQEVTIQYKRVDIGVNDMIALLEEVPEEDIPIVIPKFGGKGL